MSQLVEIVKRQLTQEYERQVTMLNEQRDLTQALSQLEAKYKSLVNQIEDLENAKAPVDLIALYIQTGGTVWISKKVWVDNNGGPHGGIPSIEVSGHYISGYYAQQPNDPGMKLATGLYRLVLIALPDTPKSGKGVDDYGASFDFEKTK